MACAAADLYLERTMSPLVVIQRLWVHFLNDFDYLGKSFFWHLFEFLREVYLIVELDIPFNITLKVLIIIVLVILVLVWRPYGLFGRTKVTKL